MSQRKSTEVTQGYIAVGEILGPWGLRGEIKVMLLTDFPERFARGECLFLRGQSVTVQESRPQGERLVVRLREVEDRTQAEGLRGALLEIPEEALQPLPPGEFYRHQLLGLGVWSSEGVYLGQVADILTTGSNDVFLVRGASREYAIPDLRDIVQQVDLLAGRMVIQVIPGLVDRE